MIQNDSKETLNLDSPLSAMKNNSMYFTLVFSREGPKLEVVCGSGLKRIWWQA